MVSGRADAVSGASVGVSACRGGEAAALTPEAAGAGVLDATGAMGATGAGFELHAPSTRGTLTKVKKTPKRRDAEPMQRSWEQGRPNYRRTRRPVAFRHAFCDVRFMALECAIRASEQLVVET